MPQAARTYVPTMSDETVEAKTGKNWARWFGVLDKAGARSLEHASIATHLREVHGVSGWWSQMVTVEYERARGLRAVHETSSGFSVSVSKTIAASVPTVYAATVNAAKRKQWFPKGTFELSSQTKNKYFRGAWNGSARLEMGFYAKGEGKSLVALAVNKLSKKTDVERERTAWKAALAKLQQMLER